MRYRGRFAPTPSGPLHFGSLVAALASWLDARSQDGLWFVRIDDIDPPREVPGAADNILRQLAQFGLHWDGHVRYQHQRHEAYRAALTQLLNNEQAFYCTLSRKALAALNHCHPGNRVAVTASDDAAIRLSVPDTTLCYDDGIQGRVCNNLHHDGGAFILRRRDGLFGYQLACALDDADDEITHVVRGADLLDSTLRQRWLLDCLGLATPHYAHLPVITGARDVKLSKSIHSQALNPDHAAPLLRAALLCMGLAAPRDTQSVDELLTWATQHYAAHRWPTGLSQPLPDSIGTLVGNN